MFQNELYLQCYKDIEKVTCRTFPQRHLQLVLDMVIPHFPGLRGTAETLAFGGGSGAQRRGQPGATPAAGAAAFGAGLALW